MTSIMPDKSDSSEHLDVHISADLPTVLCVSILACFFLSGVAGLMYEVLWVRMIDKVIGSAPFAVATVLSVFMGGLALGSYGAARHIDRLSSKKALLKLYGGVEIAIGIYALILPQLIEWVKPLYSLAYNALFHYFWPYQVLTFAGCCVLLIIPTTLMGITLPLLCRFYVVRLGHLGVRTGRLYGLNTAGAAVGAVLCGFVLIRVLGVWGTLLVTAGTNFFVGSLCILLAKKATPAASEGVGSTSGDIWDPPSYSGTSPDGDGPDKTMTWALWIFAVSGFSSMAYEVFWTRLLGLIIGPTTYSFTIVVATFIVGLALGSVIFGWLGDRSKNPFLLLAITQVCAAFSALGVSQFLGTNHFFSQNSYTRLNMTLR